MNFGLIIIGDEILSGKRADKHLAKAIEVLGARGLHVGYADYVGDDPDRITSTLARAFATGDAVFSFGGIGATPDDHTRQCAARALQRELVLHPQAKALILERMQDVALEQGHPYDPDRSDNQHRLNMGVFPTGAQIIPNPFNKIPGFFCARTVTTGSGAEPSSQPHTLVKREGETNAAQRHLEPVQSSQGAAPRTPVERGGVYFFPGFPVMAWPMLEWVLDTHFVDHFRSHAWQERSVVVFGAMEATLTPLMEQIEQIYDVKVFSLPSVDHPEYGRHIELGVKGSPLAVEPAYVALLAGLHRVRVALGPELVRP